MAQRKLRLNDICEVVWLDSGMGIESKPGKGKGKLIFNTTYGRVSYLGKDKDVHEKLCKKNKKLGCRCGWVELAMCSGPQAYDSRANLAGIWIHSISSVKVYENVGARDD
jgi:hypothetical protein